MKKLLLIFMASVLILSLSACGEKPTGGSEQSKPAEESFTLREGVISVAISPDFAPMEFVDTSKTGQDQYVGFDVFLSKFIAEELGLELEIKAMGFDACMAAVQTNNVDMSLCGFSWKEDRAKNFNLSDYYYAGDNETEQTIIVAAKNEGKFTKAEDFSGLTIAAQTASLQLDLCEKQLPKDCKIKEFGDIGTAVEALRNGNVDGVAVAAGNAEAIIAGNGTLAMSGFGFEVAAELENNVILINKENDLLLKKVNECLAKAYEKGYYAEWYAEAQKLAGIETAQEVVIK